MSSLVRTSFTWNSAPLIAAKDRAYLASMKVAAARADAAGGKDAGAKLVGHAIHPTGLGGIFEEGARPHVIQPHRSVLYLKGLDVFVTGPVRHPGRAAQPYIAPEGERWATEDMPAALRVSYAAGGYA